LKSGDLSIKTTNTEEAEALRQFADDWMSRIRHASSIQIPTYCIIVHGICTISMDMDKFDKTKAEILQDNKPFIPEEDIK
jgi:hypothetical protein